jgi:Protein of unknown function DUF115
MNKPIEIPLTHEDLVKLGVFSGEAPKLEIIKAVAEEKLAEKEGNLGLPFDPDKLHELDLISSCNTTDQLIIKQTSENIRRGLPQAKPCPPIVQHKAVLVCGGPSLNLPEVQQKLVQEYWRGGVIFCVNASYDWCIERNIRPSGMIMIDAREFNSRFVEKNVECCKYFLASQCHPKTFDLCADRETYIWHALSAGDTELKLLDEYYWQSHAPVTLGTSVGIRAISLLRMIGFLNIDIFGLDSCWVDDNHHAYKQSENDYDGLIAVWLRPEGRDDLAQRFLCSPWHCKQAMDFQALMRERSDMFQLNVHGPGLIAEIMRTGAQLDIPPEALSKGV